MPSCRLFIFLLLALLPWRGALAGDWLTVAEPSAAPPAVPVVRALGTALGETLDGLLRGHAAPARPLAVRLVPGAGVAPGASAGGELRLGVDAPVLVTAHALARELLRQRLALLGAVGAKAGVPDWLAAALVTQVMGDDGGPGVSPAGLRLPELPGAGMPFADPTALAGRPVSPEFAVPYLLYGRYCLALAVVLDRGGGGPGQPPPVLRLLQLQAAGHVPAEALLLTAARWFEPGESLTGWAGREVHTLARRTSARLSPEAVAARLAAIETFPVAIPGRGGAAGSAGAGLSLDDLPEALRNGLKLDAGALEARIRDLVLLTAEAPPLLQPAIEKHMVAFKALAAGDLNRGRRDLRLARTMFAAAVERQRQIAARLDALAGTEPAAALAGPAGRRTWELFRLLAADSRARRQALDPALAGVLDRADAE